MKPGDVIRVRDWPGTFGKRFTVKRIERGLVHAYDHNTGGLRSFPVSHAVVTNDPRPRMVRPRRRRRKGVK